MIDFEWTVELLMWLVVYFSFIGVGYAIGRTRKGFANGDLKAKADMAEAKATHWEQLCNQTEDELLELQEDYQLCYRELVELRKKVGEPTAQSVWDAVREGLPEDCRACQRRHRTNYNRRIKDKLDGETG